MGYSLNWVPSPNFTPGNQTAALYGRPRVLEIGAGHWWNWPRSGATHDGIVSFMSNPARQAAPHAVLSARRVTEMVRPWDTAWCTGKANPYTYAIETDPRIMFKWGHDNPSAAERALGNEIFETLCEYIADKGYHNLPWKAHNQFPVPYTQCNPIPWPEVRQRAIEIYNSKVSPEWKRNLGNIPDVELYAKRDGAPLRNLNNVTEVIKTFPKGTAFWIKGRTIVNGYAYLLTKYAMDNGAAQGFDEYELEPKQPEPPEWQRNLRDITPVKLMVMPAQTPIVNLNDLSTIKMLGQGTWVDFVKMTTVAGREFLISSYSAANGMPNGIAKADVGVPAEPGNEKPEWLANWQDIADVVMYTRVDADLVDLSNGRTLKVIPRGTAVEIASATEYLHKKYLITKYSTDKKLGQGILVDDLDMKNPNDRPDPTPTPEPPIEPKPEWVTHDVPITNPRLMRTLVDVAIIDFSTGKAVGDPIPSGTDVFIQNQTQYKGAVYLRSKWAVENNKPWGVPAIAFSEVPGAVSDSEREVITQGLKDLLATITSAINSYIDKLNKRG